jgi:preprotein translocase subunit SecA
MPEMIEDGEPVEAIAEREAREAREAEEARVAQASVMDFTKNIHRKKDRELADLQLMTADSPSKPNQPVIAKKTQGRNDLCACGSGKKYKKCHGA